MGVFPKGLVHGFGLKVSVFPSFCFKQKNARKKCFTIFYKEKKSFYALKSSPIDELINPQRFTHKSTGRNDRKEKKSFYALKSSPIDELINPQRFTHKSTDRNDR